MNKQMANNWIFRVEDWYIPIFFMDSYVENEELNTNEDVVQLFWSLLYRTLLARESFDNKKNIDEKEIKKEYKELLEDTYIKTALDEKKVGEAELKFFLKTENLYEQAMGEIEEIVKKDIKENPGLIKKLYEENNNLTLTNAREIYEFTQKEESEINKEIYALNELKEIGDVSYLGVFSEEELKKLEEYDQYDIMEKKEGSLILIKEEGNKKLFYYIHKIHSEHKREFTQVKEEFEDFVYEYTLDETLEEICQQLMEKYDIEYNEDYLNNILRG